MNRIVLFMKMKGVVALAVTVSMLTFGCSAREVRPTSHEEAGTVHIAVLSVAPWSEYVDELQPEFGMKESEALAQVVPTTSLLDQKIIDALSMGAKAGLPTSISDMTRTTTVKSGAPTVTESSSSRVKKSGEIPSDGGEDGFTAPGTTKELGKAEGDIGMDPMMRHLAATALFQEVKLLNMFIKNAAVGNKSNYKPYIVRLQVSAMPTARNVPYDAYTTFTFFDGAEEAGSGSVNTPAKLAGSQEESKESSRMDKPDVPRVVPLLVTDNLEGILHSRSEEKIREFTAALSGMIGNVGVASALKRTLKAFESTKGTDLNSLLTVARISDNTLSVRLGAVKKGKGYTMVPRTHNITLMVLAPIESESIAVASRTTMRNARKGTVLRGRSDLEMAEIYDDVLEVYSLERDKGNRKIIGSLLGYAQDNNLGAFTAEAMKLRCIGEVPTGAPGEDCKKHTKRYAKAIWLNVISMMIGSQYGSTHFDLPGVPGPEPFTEDQTVLLMDDTKTKTIASLTGGKNIKKKYLSAVLRVQDGKNETVTVTDKRGAKIGKKTVCVKKKGMNNFVAEGVEVTGGGKKATFTFPSLKAWGYPGQWGCADGDRLIEVTYKGECFGAKGGSACIYNTLYKAKSKKKEDKKPKVAVTVAAKKVVVQFKDAEISGTATLDVSFVRGKKYTGKVAINVAGVDVVSLKSKHRKGSNGKLIELIPKDGRYSLDQNDTLIFTLKNLTEESKVVIHYADDDKVAGKVELGVKVVKVK